MFDKELIGLLLDASFGVIALAILVFVLRMMAHQNQRHADADKRDDTVLENLTNILGGLSTLLKNSNQAHLEAMVAITGNYEQAVKSANAAVGEMNTNQEARHTALMTGLFGEDEKDGNALKAKVQAIEDILNTLAVRTVPTNHKEVIDRLTAVEETLTDLKEKCGEKGEDVETEADDKVVKLPQPPEDEDAEKSA